MSYFNKLIKILKTFPEVCDAISKTKKAKGFNRHYISVDDCYSMMDVMVDFILDGEPNVIFYSFGFNSPDTIITDEEFIEKCSKSLIMNFLVRASNTSKSISIQNYVKEVIVNRIAKVYAEKLEVDFIYDNDLLTGDEFNIKDILE